LLDRKFDLFNKTWHFFHDFFLNGWLIFNYFYPQINLIHIKQFLSSKKMSIKSGVVAQGIYKKM